MITERTLRRWRKEALIDAGELDNLAKAGAQNHEMIPSSILNQRELRERILRLTQELIDHHLTKGK